MASNTDTAWTALVAGMESNLGGPDRLSIPYFVPWRFMLVGVGRGIWLESEKETKVEVLI